MFSGLVASAGISLNINYECSLLNSTSLESPTFLIMMADGDRARSPLPIPPGRALAPAIDAESFAGMAEVEAPVSWSLSDFCEKVASPDSPLHAFISGDVRDIACYKEKYYYLLMCVHFQNKGVPIVWLRADRVKGKLGTIQFSTDHSKLWKPHDRDVMATTFTTLNFRPVIDLVNIAAPMAGLLSRWYASVVIGILHGGFGGSWVRPPSPDRLKITLDILISHATATESVQRQFAIQYPNTKKISLREPEAWKNEPASLSQPPSSKQDGHDGADSNPAGTNEKIARVGSAPTLSEEHLHGPHQMQSPNPRGREINRPSVLASKPVEPPTLYDPRRRSISRTSIPLSGQADERRPVQPADPSSTSTPLKEASTGIDEATSILQGVVITDPSTEALGQGPQASPPFTNLQAGPLETPNLTGLIVRSGSAPVARGGYSSVWRGSLLSATSDDPHRTLQVALKVLHAPYTDESIVKQKLHKRLHLEMRIWSHLRHQNVVRLLGHTEEPDGPGLVSILYLHGDVLSFLARNPSVNREIICADVALGLQYLHEHNPPIIHGDLKGRNVLIDGEGRASICDFGLSIILDGGPTGHTSSIFGGSLRFLAPELLDETTRTVQTDIYAYACTCIQILFDQEPYPQLSKEAPLIRAISNHESPFEPSNEEVTFPSVLRILKRCWDHDRLSRPPLNLIIDTIKRCLYHSYRTNLGVHQEIGRRVRFICLPGVEQAKLIGVDDGGLSLVVKSSTSFRQVPIYQRYRWELMDNQNLDDSEDDSDASSSVSQKDASSSERPPYLLKWMDYSVKFRFPYSSTVSYEVYKKVAPETA